MFYQIFLSQQVKRSAVITYKNGLFELPRQLLNDLRFKRLGELENISKVTKLYSMIALCQSLKDIFWTNPFTLLGQCRNIFIFTCFIISIVSSKYSNPFS